MTRPWQVAKEPAEYVRRDKMIQMEEKEAASAAKEPKVEAANNAQYDAQNDRRGVAGVPQPPPYHRRPGWICASQQIAFAAPVWRPSSATSWCSRWAGVRVTARVTVPVMVTVTGAQADVGPRLGLARADVARRQAETVELCSGHAGLPAGRLRGGRGRGQEPGAGRHQPREEDRLHPGQAEAVLEGRAARPGRPGQARRVGLF